MKMLAVPDISAEAKLESIAQNIALEAMGLSSVVSRAAELVPNLVHAVKSFLDGKNKDKPDLATLRINEFMLERIFAKAPFTDIESLSHPVPAGFEGNLYEYSELLKKQVSYINSVPARITAFNQFVSELVTSEQARRQIIGKAEHYRNMASSRRILLAESRNFFGGVNSRISQAKYGDIIGSNAQYVQFSKNVAEVVELANQTSFADTEKLVRDSKEILEALADVAQRGTLSDISNAAFDTLGAYTETIAREIEMYSVVLYALAELRACVEQGNAKMIQALRS